MSDLLSRALAKEKQPSKHLTEALNVLGSDESLLEKQSKIHELARLAPKSEQPEFDDLFESLTRMHLDGR